MNDVAFVEVIHAFEKLPEKAFDYLLYQLIMF